MLGDTEVASELPLSLGVSMHIHYLSDKVYTRLCIYSPLLYSLSARSLKGAGHPLNVVLKHSMALLLHQYCVQFVSACLCMVNIE